MATTKTLWISLALLSVLLVAVQGQRDCTPSDFDTLHPESPIYSVLEQNVSLRAFIPGNTIILYKGLETTSSNRINCAVSKCSLDSNTGDLTFHNFQPSNASNYTIQFTVGITPTCLYRFALVEAVAPSLSETQLNDTIDKDSGELTLQPMVSPGIPPAEVHWYLNDQNISVGNTFTFDSPPVASDRGIYTANISNLAGSASLSYTITVRFDPIITMEITQTGTTDYTIHCRAIAYPQIETIELFEIRSDGTLRNLHVNAGATSTTSNQVSSNLDYEGTATFSGTDNCPKNYRCKVSTSYSNGINNTGTCLTTPNVTNLQVNETQSTSTSAYLFWSLEPNGILVTGYEFEYRLLGQNEWEQYSKSNCQSFLERYCVIDGLSPGNLYEFRVTATNSVGTGATSDIQSFHTFSPPQGRPRGVLASRKTSSGMDAIDLSWESVSPLSYAQVLSYVVIYNTSFNSTETSIDTGSTRAFYTFTNVDPSHTYFIRVGAKNMWGLGPYSALVKSMKSDGSDPNQNRIIVNTMVMVSDTYVQVSWTLAGDLFYIRALTITIDELTIQSSGNVATTRVYTDVISDIQSGRKCFIGFDSRIIYNFCVTATANNGINYTNCTAKSTTSSDTGVVTDTSICENIEPLTGGLPAYGIGLIVACSVLLVFFGFGGCGLYFGIKRNKKGGADFDSPHPSVDDVNGYPYHSKSSSSRSCMSYRHNQQHQHGIEWRTTNPLGRQESNPAVVTVV